MTKLERLVVETVITRLQIRVLRDDDHQLLKHVIPLLELLVSRDRTTDDLQQLLLYGRKS
jgi:hypothetical protein